MLKPYRFIILLLLFSALLIACSSPQQNLDTVKPQEDVPVIKPVVKQKEMPKEALFIALFTTNQVAVLDLVTGEVAEVIPVGAKPIALVKSPDNRYVYVANSGSGDVYMINTSSGEINAKISTGVQPIAMAINTEGDRLYVLDYYLNRVSVLDIKLRTMIGFSDLNRHGFDDRAEPLACCRDIFGDVIVMGRSPSTIILDETEGKVYVGNLGTWDVAVMGLQEEKEIDTYDAISGINEMFISDMNNYLYISAAGNDLEINKTILVLGLKGGDIVDKIDVGGKPVSMALSPDQRVIYVVTQNEAKLIGINLTDNKILNSVALEGEPGDIVLTEDGSKAYITDPVQGTVTLIDTDNYIVLESIEVGITPKSLVYIN